MRGSPCLPRSGGSCAVTDTLGAGGRRVDGQAGGDAQEIELDAVDPERQRNRRFAKRDDAVRAGLLGVRVSGAMMAATDAPRPERAPPHRDDALRRLHATRAREAWKQTDRGGHTGGESSPVSANSSAAGRGNEQRAQRRASGYGRRPPGGRRRSTEAARHQNGSEHDAVEFLNPSRRLIAPARSADVSSENSRSTTRSSRMHTSRKQVETVE
mgnify:CR=1 FL=1